MAIFIKDENYKQLSKIFLKDLEDYKEICKVYICTAPNQYELLFDACADILCDGTEDGECNDCLVRWLSIYDDLLLGTDGPTPEGLTKLICPITECASGGLNTTCMDDEVCCKCEVDIPGEIPYDPVVCQSLLFPSCPCLKLDSTACKTLPDSIDNTCKAYAWAALTGELGSEINCKSCIDSSKTQLGKCCKFGRKYTYIKKTTWNNNPDVDSDCGIKRNCDAYNYVTAINPELGSYIIDYGYGLDANKLFPSEGGIAAPNDGPEILCPDLGPENSGWLCNCFPACCDTRCVGSPCTKESKCLSMCDPLNDCGKYNNIYLAFYKQSFGSYKCEFCEGVSGDPCLCNKEVDPEGCDVCITDPCSSRCLVDCGGSPDWCGSFCIGNEINWPCLFNSSDGLLSIPEILTILRDLGCPCAPNFDTCDDICYKYFESKSGG